MIILDGQKTSAEISQKLQQKIAILKKKNIIPTLHIYQVGDNPASIAYVRVKQKKADELGANCVVKKYDVKTSLEKITQDLNQDNQDPSCHGIIVQLPLPKHLDPNTLLQIIDINKDVDGLTYVNQWRLINNMDEGFVPATPKGIITLLQKYNIDIEGKKAVVVGRSRLVGMPISLLLLKHNATVTICHSHTKNLSRETKTADILIVAAGQPKFIKSKHIKKNAVVVDVGISRTDHGLIGDVDFNSVSKLAKAISPVPKGVGPMTVISLFENLIQAVEHQQIKQ